MRSPFRWREVYDELLNQDTRTSSASAWPQVASDVTHRPEYDYVLVNKEFEASVAAVRALLAAKRLGRKRQPGLTGFVEQFRAVPSG